jgi:hypothetical protein
MRRRGFAAAVRREPAATRRKSADARRLAAYHRAEGERMTEGASSGGRTADAAGRFSQFVWGVTLIVIGLLLLLIRTGVIDVRMRDVWRTAFRFWPAALLLIGLASFLGPRRKDGRREGGWLIVVGILGMLNSLRFMRWSESWPLLIVAIGGSIALEALRERRAQPLGRPPGPPGAGAGGSTDGRS